VEKKLYVCKVRPNFRPPLQSQNSTHYNRNIAVMQKLQLSFVQLIILPVTDHWLPTHGWCRRDEVDGFKGRQRFTLLAEVFHHWRQSVKHRQTHMEVLTVGITTTKPTAQVNDQLVFTTAVQDMANMAAAEWPFKVTQSYHTTKADTQYTTYSGFY